jgi:hypothetical protein
MRHAQSVSYHVRRHDEFYPSGATTTPDISHIITLAHFHRLKNLLDRTSGTIAFGGQTDESRKFIAPTVVKGVKVDDSLMSECVFNFLLEYFQARLTNYKVRYSGRSCQLCLWTMLMQQLHTSMLSELSFHLHINIRLILSVIIRLLCTVSRQMQPSKTRVRSTFDRLSSHRR